MIGTASVSFRLNMWYVQVLVTLRSKLFMFHGNSHVFLCVCVFFFFFFHSEH